MEAVEHQLDQTPAWKKGWESLKKIARTSTWETIMGRLDDDQKEIVNMMGLFTVLYGTEEPGTEDLYRGAYTLLERRKGEKNV